jgi:hypothetical protein
VDRVSGHSRGQSVERKIPGRAGFLAESPDPAEQFHHGFAGEFGAGFGRVERTEPASHHTVKNGRGAIDKQGFQKAFRVLVRH